MDSTQIQATAKDFESLFKATMELYESYFQALEAAITKTPDSDVQKLSELNNLAQEAQTALEADLAVFDKAVATDMEGLSELQDKQKMHAIYAKLKK